MKANCVWVVERLRRGRWRPWSISWMTKKEAEWSRECCRRKEPGGIFRTVKYVSAVRENERDTN